MENQKKPTHREKSSKQSCVKYKNKTKTAICGLTVRNKRIRKKLKRKTKIRKKHF